MSQNTAKFRINRKIDRIVILGGSWIGEQLCGSDKFEAISYPVRDSNYKSFIFFINDVSFRYCSKHMDNKID